jgi:hypothetical protein
MPICRNRETLSAYVLVRTAFPFLMSTITHCLQGNFIVRRRGSRKAAMVGASHDHPSDNMVAAGDQLLHVIFQIGKGL